MLPVSVDTVRLFLHVLAASVWVGGQVTLAGLVPGLRALSPDAPRAVARRFGWVAWPAYGLLVVTGVWNLLEVELGNRDSAYLVTLLVKLVLVALAGVAAGVHGMTRSRALLAAGGAVALVCSLAAVLLGVQLASG